MSTNCEIREANLYQLLAFQLQQLDIRNLSVNLDVHVLFTENRVKFNFKGTLYDLVI